MPFSEQIKKKVRRKSHFKCCLCERFEPPLHVHHIIPEEEGGPSIEDNAAALCPNCHSRYGNNPDLRKQIKEKRDFWYEICENRYKNEDLKFSL